MSFLFTLQNYDISLNRQRKAGEFFYEHDKGDACVMKGSKNPYLMPPAYLAAAAKMCIKVH